jgi:hypothetical protein
VTGSGVNGQGKNQDKDQSDHLDPKDKPISGSLKVVTEK